MGKAAVCVCVSMCGVVTYWHGSGGKLEVVCNWSRKCGIVLQISKKENDIDRCKVVSLHREAVSFIQVLWRDEINAVSKRESVVSYCRHTDSLICEARIEKGNSFSYHPLSCLYIS